MHFSEYYAKRQEEKKEEELLKKQIEILTNDANLFYSECQRTGDWKKFDDDMKALFLTYYKDCDKAIGMIVRGEVSNLPEEVLGGNYGFRAQSGKIAQKCVEEADRKAITSVENARKYLEKQPDAIHYSLQVMAEAQKSLDKVNDAAITQL